MSVESSSAARNVIPTRSKERLPAGFSYPAGAQVVSAALRNVRQFEALELVFSWRDTYWASLYQARVDANGTVVVLEARYFPGWTIAVNAVPSEHAAIARDLLEYEGLPSLEAALRDAPVDAKGFGWTATYDLSTRTLKCGRPKAQQAPSANTPRSRAPVRPRSR